MSAELKEYVVNQLRRLNIPIDESNISIQKDDTKNMVVFTAHIPILDEHKYDLPACHYNDCVTIIGYLTSDKKLRFTRVELRFNDKKARNLAYSKILPKIKEIIMIFKLL